MAVKKIEKKDKKKEKEEKARIGGKTVILFVIFGLTLMPLVLSPFENLFIQQNEYSIFNNGLKGTSAFFYKTFAESGNIPLTLTSSLNSLYVLPSKNTILVEIDPVQFFDPFEIMTLINFVAGGGKLLLASQFGTGSTLTLLNNIMSDFFVDPLKDTLYELFLNFTLTGFNVTELLQSPFFTNPTSLSRFILNEIPEISPRFSYWVENNMYSSAIYENNISNSVIFLENLLVNEIPYSIVVDDIQAPYNDGVNKILVTQPNPLTLGIDFGFVGWENLLGDEQKDPFYDIFGNYTGFPVFSGYDGQAALLDALNAANISATKLIARTSPSSWVDTNGNNFYDIMDYNGSFWITALSANKRVILCTQPQIFTNLFAFSNEYDNAKFAMNLLDNLANNTPHFVVFDETKQQKIFPSFFGLILKFINTSSGIFLLIPIIPLLVYAMIARWAPKITTPKIYKKSKIIKTKGKTIFSERMKWYKEKRQFNRAIRLLYRRLKRSIVNSIELKSYDPNKTVEIIMNIKPNVNISRFRRNLMRFERIEKNQIRITTQSSFLQVFNEMKWCYDQIK